MAVARWGAAGALLGWLAGPSAVAAQPTVTPKQAPAGEKDTAAPEKDASAGVLEEDAPTLDEPDATEEASQPAEDGDLPAEPVPVQRPTEAAPTEPSDPATPAEPDPASPAPAEDSAASAKPQDERRTSEPSSTTGSSPAPDRSAATTKPKNGKTPPIERPRFPALVVAGGPMIGPHAFGNEECRPEVGRCEKNGTFFGLGLQVELRARLYKPLFAHARALFVGNISPNEPIYVGAYGFGAGLGAYGRYIFGRAEYLFFDAFGDNTFPPPFVSEDLGRDEWGRHAGLVSFGFRKTFMQRLAVELWAGPMFGPRSKRTFPDVEPDVRTLITFMAGINVAYDILRDYKKR